MSLPITPIRPVAIDAIDSLATSKPAGGGGAFQSMLTDALGHVQQAGQAANTSVDRFLSGENEEVHQVALAVTQGELAFDMFMQVRNKIVSAYQEVMRMQM